MQTWLMQTQSLLIVILMIVGLYYRKNRSRHVKVMSLAMIWDILLILQIELSRSAILKASRAIENTMILNIHVTIAVTTVIFYGIMVYTGRKLLAGESAIRTKHRVMGWSTLFLRILTFVTSFWAVAPKGTL
ncbi:MAG TPA: hypothetical protein VKY27_03410 [Bacteriovoracaceae bacterium]|nr:hypothetical protein [Bacteriovoracaceae bacterium]